MNSEFVQAIEFLAKEKNIEPQVLFDAVEEAVVSAYKKNFDSSQTVRVELHKETGTFHVYWERRGVAPVVNAT